MIVLRCKHGRLDLLHDLLLSIGIGIGSGGGLFLRQSSGLFKRGGEYPLDLAVAAPEFVRSPFLDSLKDFRVHP